MGSELELFDARLSYARLSQGEAQFHLSYAHIHKTIGLTRSETAKGWTQESILILDDIELLKPLPPLPNTIVDGYLEVDEHRYELIPLPFEREGRARLHLEFTDGTTLDVRGHNPIIRLEGDKIFLEG